MKKILILISFLIISNYSYSQKIIDKLKLNVVNNKLYIQVMINNKGPYNFLYDTGATGEGRIDQRVAKELNLKVVDSIKNGDGTGKFKMEPQVLIPQISLSKNLSKKNIVVMCRDYNVYKAPDANFIDGIIGADFLKEYLLTIDCSNNEMVVAKGSLNPNQKGVLKYQNKNEVRGRLGSIDTVFHIDTGSSLVMHVPKAVIEKLNYENTSKKPRKVRRAYTEFIVQEALLKDEIVLSGIKVKNIKPEYSETTKFINVGMGFLKNYKVTIDKANKLILIE